MNIKDIKYNVEIREEKKINQINEGNNLNISVDDY